MASLASLTAPVLAPAATVDLGVSAALVGLFVSTVYLGAMLSSLASGTIIIRYGAIRVSQGCLILCAAGLALSALGVPWLMLAGALLIGLGYGPITPASSHVLISTTPSHLMAVMFSVKQTGVPLGGALAGALIPTLVLGWGWRGAALSVSVVCGLLAVASQGTRRQLDGDRIPGTRISIGTAFDSLRLTWMSPRIRVLAISSFFFSATQLCLSTYLVTLLTHQLGMTLVAAGFVLSVAQGAGIVGRILWGYIADRLSAARRVLGCIAVVMAMSAFITAMLAAAWPYFIVLIVAAVFGATATGWNGVFLAEVARLAPEGKAGSVTGGALFITYFGVVLGPTAFAAISGVTGSLSTGFVMLGVIVLPIGLMLALRRPPAHS